MSLSIKIVKMSFSSPVFKIFRPLKISLIFLNNFFVSMSFGVKNQNQRCRDGRFAKPEPSRRPDKNLF